jgi:uncharacterized damage-inducible protein DinB
MNLNELLVPELRNEAVTTRKMLERVPPSSLAWKPNPKSWTLGELTAHIASIPGIFIATLLEDEFDAGAYRAGTDTVPAIIAAFDGNVARAQQVLGSLSDQQLLAPWKLRYGDRVVFQLPRLAVIRTAALNHLIHHRGQLSVYLRVLGVPVPAIYGPSADES